jgi:hypothetical protein
MAKASSDMLIVDRCYNLVMWACNHIANFPRSRRPTLGDRLETRLYDVLEALIRARYTSNRLALLDDVNIQLELLRFQFRMAKDQRCLSVDSYGYGLPGRGREFVCCVGVAGPTNPGTAARPIATGTTPRTGTTMLVVGCVVVSRQHSAGRRVPPPGQGRPVYGSDGRAAVRVQIAVRRRSGRGPAGRMTSSPARTSRQLARPPSRGVFARTRVKVVEPGANGDGVCG